ncbi:menaquinone biosynthesis decarboxylase [Caldinitratiruptor microaerophilus]|uniref:Menaquinone biosynthesis decarboxylase n=1 Tax=Caldinitratiruptor microaerophilus TaxID=671077 RepID=A0AA35CKJ6_9FIRM|nr:menaquinone biosynthesis decarboxylase [Caldinitratiruptor microaerophilus]BDG59217.1 menaquinone biosynthesis decarboxylase [Caldinitratiruptor microaerophilus]
MAFRDIQEFAAALEERGWLRRIKTRVSPILEITEIADRVMKQPGGGPALLFENVEGSPYPVLINAFGSMERMCLALGVERLDQIGDEIRSLMELPSPGTGLLDKLGAGLKLVEAVRHTVPRVVSRAPCQEVVEEEPDLSRLPILQCWPQDAGRFITLPLVFTKDPRTGVKNIGMYRMQVYDARTTGMHWHKHKVGQQHADRGREAGLRRLEAAVALGADPATIYAATAPLPPQVPELAFAGFLRKQPVEVVKCRTVDLEVPAHAEFVLEGYVDLDETRVEGPFGDHTGFYSPAEPYPVFHVTTITRKRNPVYPATIVGRPPMEDFYLGKATERIFLPLMQAVLPEIVDVNMPAEGVFHNCVLVRMKKRYPGHARKVAYGLWGMGLMMLAKCIVLVDDDCDVQNLSETAWRVLANIDPERDVFFARGPADDLEHASPAWRYGSKMGIDATRKLPEEGHPRPWPDDIVMSPEIKALVDRRWREYGID